MDALSRIIDDIHLASIKFLHLNLCDNSAVEMLKEDCGVFHLVLQGELILCEEHKKISLKQWDVVFIPQGRPHLLQTKSLGNTNKTLTLNTEFKGHSRTPINLGSGSTQALLLSAKYCYDLELAAPLMAALPAFFILESTQNTPPQWLRLGLEFLSTELGQHLSGDQVIINRLGDILFVQCIRNYLSQTKVEDLGWLYALRDTQLSKVIAQLHAYPNKPWTVPELANIACMSRSAFASRFKEVLGYPPLNYLTQHRMRLAAWLLRQEKGSIYHVAERVGYDSENAFSQAFKRVYNLTPSAYRKLDCAIS